MYIATGRTKMSIIEAGPDFEKQIPQTGITFILLDVMEFIISIMIYIILVII